MERLKGAIIVGFLKLFSMLPFSVAQRLGALVGWLMWKLPNRSRDVVRINLSHCMPELTEADLVPAEAGVRAQAIAATGELVDDFVVQRQGPITHIVNAPSPAATAALALADMIVECALER